ncbi:peptidase C14 caspase catalytic subunit p20, partial [Mesorhizobium sp. B2-4-14]
VVLPPPPPPIGIFVLPTPALVTLQAWVNPPRDIYPPPNDVIFNNIHNTTIINNTTINENNNQGGGLTTGQKLTAGAVGLGAAALATKVALPAVLQKKEATLAKQNPGGLPVKPGRGSRQPGGSTPLSKTLPADRLTGHALPGADGKTLPLVNGRPVLNGQNLPNPNLPNNKSRKLLNKQGTAGGNAVTGNAVVNGQNLPNNPNLPNSKSRKLLNKPGTAGGNAVAGNPAVNGQNRANGQGQNSTGQNETGKNGKFRRAPGANGTPVANGTNNPSALKGQNSGQTSPNGKFRKLHNQGGGQTNGQANGAQVDGSGPKFHRLPANGSGGGDVQQKFKVNNGNPQLKVQGQPKPQRPEFHAQPKQQMQEMRRQPQAQPRPPKQQMQEVHRQPQAQPRPQQPPAVKKPSCGHPNEPACKQ